jgi:hypothetical protein
LLSVIVIVVFAAKLKKLSNSAVTKWLTAANHSVLQSAVLPVDQQLVAHVLAAQPATQLATLRWRLLFTPSQ